MNEEDVSQIMMGIGMMLGNIFASLNDECKTLFLKELEVLHTTTLGKLSKGELTLADLIKMEGENHG